MPGGSADRASTLDAGFPRACGTLALPMPGELTPTMNGPVAVSFKEE
jgi:hypothetical protein